MKKNIITNKITPCCGLPFSIIYWWVSNLTLNSEADRQYLLTQISQNGVLSIDGWKVLVNSGTLESDSPLVKSDYLNWFSCGKQPNCEQLRVIIESYKLSNFVPEIIYNAEAKLISEPISPTYVFEPGLIQIGFAAPGTYPNAGGITIEPNTIGLIFYDGNTGFQKMQIDLPIYQYLADNNEYLATWIDADNNIVFGIRKDGSIYSKSIEDLQKAVKITSHFTESDNDEWINVVTDKEGNILSGRKSNNTLVEQTAIETPKISIKDELNLSTKAFNLLVNQFRNTSIGVDKSNLSDFAEIKMPLPNSYLTLNLLIEENDLPKAKHDVIPIDCELWDKSGNYFKKPIKISVQGDSSSGHLRKGYTLDLVDFTLQFGNLVAADSYYLKGFYTDAFRGVSIVAYRFFKDVVNSRPYQDRKAFYSDYTAKSIATGIGTLGLDMSSGANYIADGFPVALYCNGTFYGMYCIVQKKHRDNFDMKKNTAKHVWLDGYLSPWFFFSNNVDWTAFEVRNPKSLKNMDGSDYNGDFPKEIQASATKTYIQNFASRINEINAETTTATKRTKFLQYFDLKSIIDYFLVSNLIYNNDGFAKNWQWYTKDGIKWAVAAHDCDNILGINWKGNFIEIEGIETSVLGTEPNSPTNLALQLFKPEIKQRYDELKALKILTSSYFVDKLKSWLDDITYPMLKADLEKWTETPSYRPSKTNDAYWICVALEGSTIPLWNDSTAYVIGDKVRITGAEHEYIFKCIQNNINKNPITGTYPNSPYELGFYNSLDRVRQVIEKRITIIETTINN